MINWIASSDDPRLEPYRHVGDAAWLRQENLFVAEGRLVPPTGRTSALIRLCWRSEDLRAAAAQRGESGA